jgi:hypothetical protein
MTVVHSPHPRPSPYTPDQRAFAALAWTMRAEEERRSAAVFADLLGLLADAKVPLEPVRDVHGIVGDEICHAELCAHMARTLGAPEPTPRALARTGPIPDAPDARRARTLEIVLVEGAIGETISSALFAAGRRATLELRARDALGRILRDEALHARAFWELLDALRAERDAEPLHVVAARALGAIEQTQMVPTLQRLERGEPFDAAWAELGILAPAERVEAFYGAVEKRVVPALSARGLDGERAWASRYRAATHSAATPHSVRDP